MLNKVYVNGWMEREMLGYDYFVIYVSSAKEWVIMYAAETLEEAQEELANQMDGEENEGLAIINYKGEIIG